MRNITFVCCAVLASFVPLAAQAIPIAGIARGTVAPFAETLGRGVDVFGLDGAGLAGQEVRVDFSYDTALAPVPTTGTYADGSTPVYETSDPFDTWLTMSVTVNGRTHVLVGSDREVDIYDVIPVGPSDADHLQLVVEGGFESPDGSIFQRQFLDMFLDFAPPVLDNAFLPVNFATDSVIPSGGGTVFRINESERDPVSHALLDERYVNFEIVVTEVSVSPVPEPGSAVMVGLGLALLGQRRRAAAYRSLA